MNSTITGAKPRRRRQKKQQEEPDDDMRQTAAVPALDLPPPVFLPFQEQQQAKLCMRTLRSLASGKIGEDSHDNHGNQGQPSMPQPQPQPPKPLNDATFSNCNPIIAFEQYLVFASLSSSTTTGDRATTDPQVCFYRLRSSSPSSPIHTDDAPVTLTSETTLDLVSTIPLAENSAPIIALVATKPFIEKRLDEVVDTVLTYTEEHHEDVALKQNDCEKHDTNTVLLGHVVALSFDGMVHVMECRTTDGDDVPQQDAVVLVSSWRTGRHARSTVTCITAVSSFSPPTLINQKSENVGEEANVLHVVVGFQSGCIESWILSLPTSVSGNDHDQQNPIQTHLSWWGVMNQPVLGLYILLQSRREPVAAQKTAAATTTTSTATTTADLDSEENDKRPLENTSTNEEAITESEADHCDQQEQTPNGNLLVVCLQPATPSSSSPSTMDSFLSPPPKLLEVIDLAAVKNAWTTNLHDQETTTDEHHGNSMNVLSLSKFTVEPTSANGVAPTTPVVLGDLERQNTLLSAGSFKASNANSNLSFICAMDDNSTKCAAFLSNKAIVALKTDTLPSSSTLSWSLSNDFPPYVLSYPTVGCGIVDDIRPGQQVGKEEQRRQYVASCLRGGTVYLLPATSTYQDTGKANTTRILVFPFPHELDLDLDARFLQGFTAGMLQGAKRGDGKIVREPVLVYAWPGGYFDIFSCTLTEPNFDITPQTTSTDADCAGLTDEMLLLQSLVDNGALRLLQTLLEGLNPNDPLLEQSLWSKAKAEYDTAAQDWTTELLMSDSYVSLRHLLLQLSEVSDDWDIVEGTETGT